MDLNVALLQIKPKLGRVADNLALIKEQVEQAITIKADLRRECMNSPLLCDENLSMTMRELTRINRERNC